MTEQTTSQIKTTGSASAVEGLAQSLGQARRSGHQIGILSDEPLSTADAYAVQEAVLLELNEEVGGWKAAGESPEGISLVAPLHASTVGSSAPGRLPESGWNIEVELAFRLGRDLQPGENLDGESLMAALSEIQICLELCWRRLSGAPSRTLLLADGLANDGVFLGGGVKPHLGFDLGDRAVRLSVNAKPVFVGDTGSSSATTRTLEWLLRQPARLGGLRSNQVIITGSLTGLTPILAGDVVEASIDGIGSLRFVAPAQNERAPHRHDA